MKALILLDVPVGGKLPNEIGVTLQASQFSFNFAIVDEYGKQIGQFAPVGDDVTIEQLTSEMALGHGKQIGQFVVDDVAEKDAEIARLNRQVDSFLETIREDQAISRLAEPRKVSDAQRERIKAIQEKYGNPYTDNSFGADAIRYLLSIIESPADAEK